MAAGDFGGRARHEDELARNDGCRQHRYCSHRCGDDIPGSAGILLDHACGWYSLTTSIHHSATANTAFEQPGGAVNSLRKTDFLGEKFELVALEILAQTAPCLQAIRARAHHTVHPDKRHAAQNERSHGRRKIETSGETARGDDAAI